MLLKHRFSCLGQKAARDVFALAKSRKVFAELFAKSDLLCPQALGVSFGAFLCAFCVKEKRSSELCLTKPL